MEPSYFMIDYFLTSKINHHKSWICIGRHRSNEGWIANSSCQKVFNLPVPFRSVINILWFTCCIVFSNVCVTVAVLCVHWVFPSRYNLRLTVLRRGCVGWGRLLGAWWLALSLSTHGVFGASNKNNKKKDIFFFGNNEAMTPPRRVPNSDGRYWQTTDGYLRTAVNRQMPRRQRHLAVLPFTQQSLFIFFSFPSDLSKKFHLKISFISNWCFEIIHMPGTILFYEPLPWQFSESYKWCAGFWIVFLSISSTTAPVCLL